MLEYVQKCFRHYVDFSGRVRRREYWFFVLFNALVYIALITLFGVFMVLESVEGSILTYVLIDIFGLGTLLPGIAVTVRRLHDINKSTGFFFIVFIPLGGAIWLIVQMCRPGTVGDNRFGAEPKAIPDSDNSISNL